MLRHTISKHFSCLCQPRRSPIRQSALFALGTLAAAAICAHVMHAEPTKEPSAYTVTVHFAPAEASIVSTYYRLGPQILVDQSGPPGEVDGSLATRKRTLYNLDTKLSLSWNPSDPAQPCERSNFVADDLQDPFQDLPDSTDGDLKRIGTQHIHGFTAQVFESTGGGDVFNTKLWIDPKTGLILKVQFVGGDGAPKTYAEVTQISFSPPLASLFTVPASCSVFILTPKTETLPSGEILHNGRFGKLSWDALVGPPTRQSCTMLFRVDPMGQWNKPLTSGFQVAVDLAPINPLPRYHVRLDGDGHATFSGGTLHQIAMEGQSGLFRIDNVPEQFVIDVEFGKNGSASARIYRHCYVPKTLLQLTGVDLQDIQKGGTWEWVAPGMYRNYPN